MIDSGGSHPLDLQEIDELKREVERLKGQLEMASDLLGAAQEGNRQLAVRVAKADLELSAVVAERNRFSVQLREQKKDYRRTITDLVEATSRMLAESAGRFIIENDVLEAAERWHEQFTTERPRSPEYSDFEVVLWNAVADLKACKEAAEIGKKLQAAIERRLAKEAAAKSSTPEGVDPGVQVGLSADGEPEEDQDCPTCGPNGCAGHTRKPPARMPEWAEREDAIVSAATEAAHAWNDMNGDGTNRFARAMKRLCEVTGVADQEQPKPPRPARESLAELKRVTAIANARIAVIEAAKAWRLLWALDQVLDAEVYVPQEIALFEAVDALKAVEFSNAAESTSDSAEAGRG